jgi:hypothetical protein
LVKDTENLESQGHLVSLVSAIFSTSASEFFSYHILHPNKNFSPISLKRGVANPHPLDKSVGLELLIL